MANQYTKLFINNQAIDLQQPESIPLNITRRVNSIEGGVKGDYSRVSITVLATKNNIAILGDGRGFFEFRIEGDGAPTYGGIAKVKSGATYSQGYASLIENYQINLISNNSNWFVLLGDTNLSELTDLIIPWNAVSITGGFLAEPLIRDYAFTFVKLKEWQNPVGAPPNLRYRLSLFEATPCLYIKPLLVAAFASIGYTIKSDYFDTDEGMKLITPTFLPEKMPLGYNEKYLNTAVTIGAFSWTGFPNVAIPFDTVVKFPPSNPNAWDVILFRYDVLYDGYYEIDYGFKYGLPTPDPVPASFLYTAALWVNGANAFSGISFSDTSIPFNGEERKSSTVLQLVAGDYIECRIFMFGGVSMAHQSGFMNITGEATPVPGFDIDFKFLLQDKFSDLLEGLIDIKNLSFETDASLRIVTIEPKDSYLNTSKTPTTSEFKQGFYKNTNKDYSKLIDYNKKSDFIILDVEGSFNYSYNSDNDPTADWIEGINDQKIYEARFKMSSGADTSSVKTKAVRYFHKTIHILDDLAKYPNTNTAPQFPLIYPQNNVLDPTATEARQDIKPRILYFAGQRFGGTFDEDDGLIELHEFQGLEVKNPLSFMVNYNDRTGLDPNLGFDNQIINGVESIGLMQRQYLQELARIDKGQTRRNYVVFNSIDNHNFSFREKAYIDGSKFIVQLIRGYNPIKDSPTEFTFFLDVFPTQGDISNIQNSGLKGVVISLF